jgi:hypothetical protein
MTPAQEWEQKRRARESGSITAQQWLDWADKYVNRLSGGPWRKHCEQHIRFVERQVRDGRA